MTHLATGFRAALTENGFEHAKAMCDALSASADFAACLAASERGDPAPAVVRVAVHKLMRDVPKGPESRWIKKRNQEVA